MTRAAPTAVGEFQTLKPDLRRPPAAANAAGHNRGLSRLLTRRWPGKDPAAAVAAATTDDSCAGTAGVAISDLVVDLA